MVETTKEPIQRSTTEIFSCLPALCDTELDGRSTKKLHTHTMRAAVQGTFQAKEDMVDTHVLMDYHLMFPQLTKWCLTVALYGILKLWIADNVLVVWKQDINERGLQNTFAIRYWGKEISQTQLRW